MRFSTSWKEWASEWLERNRMRSNLVTSSSFPRMHLIRFDTLMPRKIRYVSWRNPVYPASMCQTIRENSRVSVRCKVAPHGKAWHMPVEAREINVTARRSTIWTHRMEGSWSTDMKGVDTHEEPTYSPRPDLKDADGSGTASLSMENVFDPVSHQTVPKQPRLGYEITASSGSRR